MMFSRRMTGRLALGMLLSSIAVTSCSAADPLGDEADVTRFRDAGDRDDTAAFARALATGRPVFVPQGIYRVSMLKLPAGARLRGEGAGSVIRAADPDAYAIMYADSGSEAAMVNGITVQSLVLQGDVASRDFREHSHLLVLQGVSNATIDNVGFQGFRGDGLMLEGGDARAPDPVKAPRHNRAVRVTNCWFDGVNRKNRNAISIVDGTDILIADCRFRNVTRADMPGAIDIEPNPYPFYRIADIAVRDCTFDGVGGNMGAISVFVPPEVATPAARLTFTGNRMTNYVGSGADYSIRCDNVDAGQRNGIVISGHVGSRGQRPFAILSGVGIVIGNDCRFADYRSAALLGYAGSDRPVRSVSIGGHYDRIGFAGKPNQFGLAVFRGDGLKIGGSWTDCGDGSPDATAILFLQGQSRAVDLSQLVVRSPGGRTRRAVTVADNHRLDRASSRMRADTGTLPAWR